ncbi:hypothetical protein Y1Q_0019693 [Alligator mississippiensis]|uniref:Uncharacterized protein n=1 Tax=Alligator mississippiensis TaxID=8496 RepID=A0A151PF77_ALLMI|nr:hypothetical protein Y1Q_0019693 [Alligator mississippiensis]
MLPGTQLVAHRGDSSAVTCYQAPCQLPSPDGLDLTGGLQKATLQVGKDITHNNQGVVVNGLRFSLVNRLTILNSAGAPEKSHTTVLYGCIYPWLL